MTELKKKKNITLELETLRTRYDTQTDSTISILSLWLWISEKSWANKKLLSLQDSTNYQAAPIIVKLNFIAPFRAVVFGAPAHKKIMYLLSNIGSSDGRGKHRQYLWQSGHIYGWGCCQVQHGHVINLQSTFDWMVLEVALVIIFCYSERNIDSNEHS